MKLWRSSNSYLLRALQPRFSVIGEWWATMKISRRRWKRGVDERESGERENEEGRKFNGDLKKKPRRRDSFLLKISSSVSSSLSLSPSLSPSSFLAAACSDNALTLADRRRGETLPVLRGICFSDSITPFVVTFYGCFWALSSTPTLQAWIFIRVF